MLRPMTVLLCFASLILPGCASTPRQAVELSATVDRDIESLHQAHLALVKLHFDRLEKDVNAFVDGTYRPHLIRESMLKFGLVEKIADSAKASGADPLTVMEVYVSGVEERIAALRAELLAPIRAQRDKVLVVLEDSYRRVHDGNAVVTGHLASIVRVQDAQDELLARAGLQGLRERVVDSTARVSDQIAALTGTAERVGSKLDDVQARSRKTIEAIKKELEKLQ